MTFTINGEPTGKARPRITRNGTYTPQKTVDYKELVQWSFREQCKNADILELPLSVTIIMFFGIPKSASKKIKEQMLSGKIRPTKKPDIDNVIKAILDALNGVAYKDDTQVVEVHSYKFYNDEPRVMVKIEEIKILNKNCFLAD